MNDNKISINEKREIWEEYSDDCAQHFVALQTMNIGSAIIELYTKEYPDRLVDHLLEKLRENPILIDEKNGKPHFIIPDINPTLFNFISLFLFRDDEKENNLDGDHLVEVIKSLPFRKTTYAQNLIFQCAHFEAFVKKNLEMLYKIRPQDFQNYKEKIGFKKQLNILSKFVEDLPEMKILIELFFQIRHIFVHKNGRIDKEFFDNTKIEENELFKIDKKFPLDSNLIQRSRLIFLGIMTIIYFKISIHHLQIPEEEVRKYSSELTKTDMH